MADNDLSDDGTIEKEPLLEDENENGVHEDQDGSSENTEEIEQKHEDETPESDENLKEPESSENIAPPPEEPAKKSYKKLITISSVIFGVLISITAGVFVLFGDNLSDQETVDGTMTPPPGYLAKIAIPPRQRKRMKTGLELSREQTRPESNSSSAFSTPDATKPEHPISLLRLAYGI